MQTEQINQTSVFSPECLKHLLSGAASCPTDCDICHPTVLGVQCYFPLLKQQMFWFKECTHNSLYPVIVHAQLAKLVDYDSKRSMYYVEYTVQVRFHATTGGLPGWQSDMLDLCFASPLILYSAFRNAHKHMDMRCTNSAVLLYCL